MPISSRGSATPEPLELSPLDVIALEALTEPFCPTAMAGGVYRPGTCLPWCTLCRDLLIRRDSS